MALRVNHNFQSEFSHVNLKKTENRLNTSLERLSTGLRINSAKDDAAGLFIADQLKLVSKALEQGSRNANDGISAAQIAESSLSQIYEKLSTMYTKASQAATDTNDTNSRLSIKRDVEKLADAIDKIAKGTEFNGIELLTGNFQNKKIHYGARADQTLDISIDSATAADLGAYVIDGNGKYKAVTNTRYSNMLNANDNFAYTSGDTVTVADVNLESSLTAGAVDAYDIADAINNNATLQNLGIEASASNTSTAGRDFQSVTMTSGITISVYVGASTTASFSFSYAAGDTMTLDDVIDKINTNAAANNANITATKSGNRLVLTTDNGETIGVQIDVKNAATGVDDGIDLAQFLELGSSAQNITTQHGSAVKVGDLTVVGEDTYDYDFTGITSSTEGLGVSASTDATHKSLNALASMMDSNSEAELAMRVIDKTIKAVDTMRSQLGSVQQNLQALVDNNDYAATQTSEAESRIRNVDFAKEMSEFTKQQTLMQSGIAMLAQANQLPQMVLQLLR